MPPKIGEVTTYKSPDRTHSLNYGSEQELLESFLSSNRSTLLAKCDGLTLEQLRQRPVATSSMSLLGLVRHMALVEQWWFEKVLRGDESTLVFSDAADPDYEWNNLDSSIEETFETFYAVTERINDYVSTCTLDQEAVGEDRRSGHRTLRWIYLHMIEEYARHNGHADLLRELIDGSVGF